MSAIKAYLAEQDRRKVRRKERERDSTGASPSSPAVGWVLVGAAVVVVGALALRRSRGSPRDPQALGLAAPRVVAPPALASVRDPFSLEAYAADCDAMCRAERDPMRVLLGGDRPERPDAFRHLLETELRTRKGGADPREEDAEEYYDTYGAMHPYEEAAYNARTRDREDEY